MATPGPPPSRGYPLATHRGVEAALGFALIVIALVAAVDPGGNIDFTGTATLAAAIFGLALATLGVATTREGTGVAPSSHRAFDYILAAAMLVVAILLGIGGSMTEAIVLAAFAVGHGLLSIRTRYTIAGGE